MRTSLDPRVQRAAEAALAGVHKTVAMVALRASTGQVLAAVSDPTSVAYNQALQGAYPAGVDVQGAHLERHSSRRGCRRRRPRAARPA